MANGRPNATGLGDEAPTLVGGVVIVVVTVVRFGLCNGEPAALWGEVRWCGSERYDEAGGSGGSGVGE